MNKDPDTCYSFWIGASLKMLGRLDLADYNLSKAFTMSCHTMGTTTYSFLFAVNINLMKVQADLPSVLGTRLMYSTHTCPCAGSAWWVLLACGPFIARWA